LSDIKGYAYPEPISIPYEVTKEDIQTEIKKLKPDKAPGPDNIPNRMLKLAAEELAPALALITQACYALRHHPAACKETITVIVKKHYKKDYKETKTYRPIALASTLKKLIESLVARRMQDALEEYRLLPETQMGARSKRSTVTVFKLFTEQIHAV